ncbi:MAG: hypothetical protein ABNH21_06800 [Glaciecola sp.]|jgi:hypothetical protein
MAIHKNYKIAELRKFGDKFGREGVALEVIEAINEFDGSYKGAMELCGKLLVMGDVSTFDEYWQEQVEQGVGKQALRVQQLIAGG